MKKRIRNKCNKVKKNLNRKNALFKGATIKKRIPLKVEERKKTRQSKRIPCDFG